MFEIKCEFLKKYRKRKDRKLFNEDVADSNTLFMTLVLVSAGEVVLDNDGDDPVQPGLAEMQNFSPIFAKMFDLVLPLYLILSAIYFENPVDPHNSHDVRFPKRSTNFADIVVCHFDAKALQKEIEECKNHSENKIIDTRDTF